MNKSQDILAFTLHLNSQYNLKFSLIYISCCKYKREMMRLEYLQLQQQINKLKLSLIDFLQIEKPQRQSTKMQRYT